MCIGSKLGANIRKPKKLGNIFEYFFGEDQSRYILEVDKKNLTKVEKLLENNNIFYEDIGYTQREKLEIEKEMTVDIKDLCEINNQWYKNY